MNKKTILILVILAALLASCGGEATPDPALDPLLVMTAALATVNASNTQTAWAIPTNTPMPIETPTPTGPTQFTPGTILTVTVSVATANCRFGPDTAYAGPGRLRYGKVLEAIGRDEGGQWLLIREPGGQNSCWMNTVTLNVEGNVNNLSVAPAKLPINPAYPAPSNITSSRVGEWVQLRWGEVSIPSTAIYPEGRYLLDLWLCQNGGFVHALLSTNDLSASLQDQPGCAEASHGQIFTATREGYSQPAAIPWP